MAQVRGEKLINALKDAIKHLAVRAAENGDKYVFNASELSRVTGISRVTIGKYEEVIEEILKDVKANFRVKYGQAHLQQLLNQIDALEKEKKILEKENTALRNNHLEIYKRLYAESVDMASFIKVELVEESIRYGKCILCHQQVEKIHSKNKSNVFQLNKKQSTRKNNK